MSSVGDASVDVMRDPEYRQTLIETLGEIRDNVKRMGRENAVRDFGHLVETMGAIRQGPNQVMLVVVLFELADFHERLTLVEEYAQAVSENTSLLSQGKLDEAHESAQRARSLKARIDGA